MRQRKQRAKLVFAFIGMVMLASAGCEQKKSGGWPMGDMTVDVVAAAALRQPIEEKISLVGSLVANESVEIKSEIDGLVEEINFEEGQAVEKGQLLIAIDKSKLMAQLAEAEAKLNLAQTTNQRYESLIETQAVSRQEFDEVQANLATARAAVDLVKAQFNDATIEASFSGIMGERLVSLGQYISKGTSLTYLVNQDPMKVELRVPERYISRLKDKQEVTMVVAAYPDEQFKGEVYFIDPRIDELTRTTLVKARVSNTDGRLRSGMFVNLDLTLNVRSNAIVIPETALIPKGEDVSVFIIDADNKAQMRPVTVGIRFAGSVEILSGLEEGEKVIIEGFQKIGPGTKVATQETKKDARQPEVKESIVEER